MWHKFPYMDVFPIDHGDAFPGVTKDMRPVVPVTLTNGGREAECDALVDSGCEYCLFPLSKAVALGLATKDAKRVPDVVGYGYAGSSDLLFWPVTIRINPGFVVTTLVAFSESQERGGFGILGSRGFFSEVEQVSFMYKQGGFAFLTAEPPDASA